MSKGAVLVLLGCRDVISLTMNLVGILVRSFPVAVDFSVSEKHLARGKRLRARDSAGQLSERSKNQGACSKG